MKTNNDVKLAVRVLALLTFVLVVWIGASYIAKGRVRTVTIAAGSSKGESFLIMRALKTVVESHHPNLRLVVQENSDSVESIADLEKGTAQFAPVQADAPPGPTARLMAVIYEDKMQIMVPKGSQIHSFSDLKQKRIALSKSGSQYASFLILAAQYGLQAKDFIFVGADEESANLAFAAGVADAIFRVRSVPNDTLRRFAATGQLEFVPIDRGQGMHLNQPSYEPSVIPMGTYGGDPAVPPLDLNTVAMQRLLLVRRDVDSEIIRAVAEVLMDRKQELAAAIQEPGVRPLVFQIKNPSAATGSTAAVHPAAEAYYNHIQPSFAEENSAVLIAGGVLATLALLWTFLLRYSAYQVRVEGLRSYHNTVLHLMDECRSATAVKQLETVRAELMMILAAAVRDLGNGQMTDAHFLSFQTIWTIAYQMSGTLHKLTEPAPQPTASPAGTGDGAWKKLSSVLK